MLHRITNYRDSIVHRLPPETLATVASHLPDDKSLIIATHLCHLWRSTFLSFPYLWSHLTFENERRTLVFLERSGSALVSVDLMGTTKLSKIAKESLKRIANRLATLRGVHSLFLDELLAESPPMLKNLNAVQLPQLSWEQSMQSLPSLRSLAITDLGCHLFHVPNLTNLLFEQTPFSSVSRRFGNDLIDFFRSCPLLEVILLRYGNSSMNVESTSHKASIEAIPLPCLRSFTHESPTDEVHVSLFNRLSLPPTCDVTFSTETLNQLLGEGPWNQGFSALRELPYLSDIKMVKRTTRVGMHPSRITLRTEFFSSENRKISFNMTSYSPLRCSHLAVKKLLDFLESSGVIHSIQTLHFENCLEPSPNTASVITQLQRFHTLRSLVFLQSNPILFLKKPSPSGVWCPGVESLEIHAPPPRYGRELEQNILDWVREIAVSRHKHGSPLKVVTLVFRDARSRLEFRGQTEDLNSYVKLVQVLHPSI